MTIFYREDKPWIIELSNDERLKIHLVRLRLFQRVDKSKNPLVFFIDKFQLSSRMDIKLDIK